LATFPFHHAMLQPVYLQLLDRFPCLFTEDRRVLIDVAPRILVVADRPPRTVRRALPTTLVVFTRHGFVSKNYAKASLADCDFACVSSEWVRDELLRTGIRPRLGYWVTGFPPMDAVFRSRSTRLRPVVAGRPLAGATTLLYAPTHQPLLNSVEVLGTTWIAPLRQALPDLNLIIKPHPRIPADHSEWLTSWQEAAASDPDRVIVMDADADIYQVFPFTDILLTDASSVMFYFLAMDRPIVLVTNPRRFDDVTYFDPEGPEWLWRDLAVEIERAADLPDAVRRCLERPDEKADRRAFYRARIFGTLADGRAAERIADRISALLDPHDVEREWVDVAWNSVDALGALRRDLASLEDSLAVRISRRLRRIPLLRRFRP
ncbi:MAG: CDP-glycerol glycerophosphotransferase family protein, partial [Armatimonadota bacterium]